jgi:hypothetical protein
LMAIVTILKWDQVWFHRSFNKITHHRPTHLKCPSYHY